MAYYIEHNTSDMIETQEPLTESEVIKRARVYSNNFSINDIIVASKELRKLGWIVFEDC